MKDEKDLLFKKLNKLFVKAFAQFQLIDDGDRILTGLSGGKDSLLLTELLARRAKTGHPQFQVEALHVRMADIQYESSTDYLELFCKQLGVPLHIVNTSFPSVATEWEQTQPQEKGLKQKPPCFLCSWQRRKQLFNMAQLLNCNKIALGHHQDDLLHTCLMNLLYQGRFDTMPALLQMRKMPLQIIRPLCLIPEAAISEYARLRQYEKQVKLCPYEHDSNRTTARRMFEQAEQQNPEVRFSMWRALEREGKLKN